MDKGPRDTENSAVSNSANYAPGPPLDNAPQSKIPVPPESSREIESGGNQNDKSQTSGIPASLAPNTSNGGDPGATNLPTNLTILKSIDAQISVIKISQEVDGVRPNWESSLATDFLAPSPNDQWNCPDVIDFDLILVFAQREKTGSSEPFVSPTSKTKHPESTLVRFLHRLQSPPPALISEWAKIIAASVEVMAFKLYNPPPPTPDANDEPINQGLQVLEWLEGLKKLLSNFETTSETDQTSADAKGNVVQRSHAIDVLKEFAKVIIDVYMGYIIFQVHGLSGPPLKNSQVKRKSQAQEATANLSNSGSNPGLTQIAAGDALKTKTTAVQKLKEIQTRHNFQPLTYFLVGGVQGLFVASKNYRHSPVSECMSFIQSMAAINEWSKSPRTPEEPIWKNLSAYLVEIFKPAFQSPGKIVPIQKKPDPHELAQAITVDFLTHWRTNQPSCPFLIPQAPRQITEK
ncbi:hypothetical protein PtB15_1B63 [Puccinia triticina]|nr:hypothetical protein PtB15_1B63 [Puccinia triticina]